MSHGYRWKEQFALAYVDSGSSEQGLGQLSDAILYVFNLHKY